MLEKKNRIHLKPQYDAIFKANRKFVSPCIVMYICRNDLSYGRYGVIASKKVGKAHVRNLAKRRLRGLIRAHMSRVKPGFDLVIICRGRIAATAYSKLRAEFISALKKGNIYVGGHEHQTD
jgi:ribonuclease P protein component